MKPIFCLGGAAVLLLLMTPSLAIAQGGGPTTANPGYRHDADGHPTGMTGNFRGWQSAQGSGGGANNFVGNGRGHPDGNTTAGHFGGWFANNHNGENHH